MNNTIYRLSLVSITVAAVTLAMGLGSPPVVLMADATPVTIASSTSGVEVTINSSRPYAFYHTGKSAAGAAATGLIAIGYEANPTAADYTAESNKLILEAGGVVLIDRGPDSVYLKSASGAPIVQIIPKVRVR